MKTDMKTKIKNIRNLAIAGIMGCALAATTTSCDDFTDIQPKGENLLASTNDLELLLNTDSYDGIMSNDFLIIGSNIIYNYQNVPSLLAVDNKGRQALLYGYFDDEVSLNTIAALTNSDATYTYCYNIIGRVSNPILKQLPMAKGDEAKKNALKAEALVARAFCHYVALQKFAPAYNGSNGDQAGIIYMTEDKDILQQHEKNTIQECLDQMLADVNDALALNSLPTKSINYMRWGKAAALTLKAHILMAMRNYPEAEAAAKEALSVNNNLYDYWANAVETTSMYNPTAPPYMKEAHDDRNIDESLFIIPNMNFLLWTSPNEWDAMETNYGRRGLNETMNKMIGMDYGMVSVGLPGWDSPYDVMDQLYTNVMGLSIPQSYLIIAECELRAGNINAAMNWLDQLRAKRLPSDFEKLEGTVTAKADAIKWMQKIVASEFVWQGWTFVWRKRWNTEAEWQTTQTRTLGGKTYTLRPDSKLWIFPFPVNATEKNSNLTNNR